MTLAYFARAIVDLMDALAIERAHLVGNSLGGRVALELGMSHPERAGRLVLLCPALAWRRERPLVPLLRLTRPELGLVQIAPRPLVEAIVRRVIPGAEEGWTAAGVDEFLRAYLTPAGRAAFYAAARHIYLDAARRAAGLLAPAGRAAGRVPVRVGSAATGSFRSPSPATSSRRSRVPVTWSSTAVTSRRSSARAGPIARSGSSSRRPRASASTSDAAAGGPASATRRRLSAWGIRSRSRSTTRTAARG